VGASDSSDGSATATKPALRAGLLDLLTIDLVPVVLGGGPRLLDHLGPDGIDFDLVEVVDAPGVTHLTYRVLK
jgi:riboflavin biosynthesis pyrimidine reductase